MAPIYEAPMTRIALIGPAPGRQGGVATVAGHLVREWSQMGVSSEVIDPWPFDELGQNLSAFLRATSTVARLRSAGATSAHVNLASRGSAWRKAALTARLRRAGLPYIVHLHGARFDSFFEGLRGPQERAVSDMFAGAAATVVLGTHWQEFATGVVGVPQPRVHVIPNGVPGPTRSCELDAGTTLKILFSGRVAERKGARDLVRAAAHAIASGVRLEVRFAGDGEVAGVAALARELGVSDSVTTLGWLGPADVAGLLDWANVFCLPSYAEGLPMSMLEAMAHEVCVIATPVGSVPDAVEHGKNGLLFEPGNIEALTQHLVALTDPVSRGRMASAGRHTWESRYSARRMADAILSLHVST
jgi:glycosyltransferase involved in cell wall biosynthesis